MFTVVQNTHSNTSSNLGRVCISLTVITLGKGKNSTILPPAMAKIVGQPGFFKLSMATDLGEGKL